MRRHSKTEPQTQSFISSFVTGPSFEILPIRVFSMVKVGVSPEVNVLATLLLAISLLMVTVSTLLLRRKH